MTTPAAPVADGPRLEEACLWADLAEVAEERDTARRKAAEAGRKLAEARAEIRTLRAQLAAPTALAA